MGTRLSYRFEFVGNEVWRTGNSQSSRIRCGVQVVDYAQLEAWTGGLLDSVLRDWLEVALAVHWADRMAPRRQGTSDYLHWGRRINLRLPVRASNVWTNATVREALESLLGSLTGDEWRIDFVSREANGERHSQDCLFDLRPDGPLRVCLFSGGLDSFAGVIAEAQEWPNDTFVLVSGSNNDRKYDRQRTLRKAAENALGNSMVHAKVDYQFHRDPGFGEREWTERSRGFLFLTLGAVTSLIVGTNILFVYENGIGALNLPYDTTQFGTYKSRALNPITLLRMQRFATLLTGSQLQVINPFLFRTKSEIFAAGKLHRVGEFIPMSFSCDGFPMRVVPGVDQCGHCSSCLLRRLSLEVAGLSRFDSGRRYLRDLTLGSYRGPETKLHDLYAMDRQVQRLKFALRENDRWRGLIVSFPDLDRVVSECCAAGVFTPVELRENLLRLYLRYVEEWERFSARRLLSQRVEASARKVRPTLQLELF